MQGVEDHPVVKRFEDHPVTKRVESLNKGKAKHLPCLQLFLQAIAS